MVESVPVNRVVTKKLANIERLLASEEVFDENEEYEDHKIIQPLKMAIVKNFPPNH